MQEAPQLDDLLGRSERSPTHLTGTSRKIRMFIKNRHVQVMPDGIVNGTTDDTSIYTVLQRTTVGIGKVKVQAVATCHYLCMAGCGLLYSSKDFGDDCVFKETIEPSNYNTYCSRKYSTNKRTFYLALNRKGQTRKAVVRFGNQLGKLASFVRVLTRNVPDVQLANIREHIHGCHQQATDDIPKSKKFHRCPNKKRKKKPQSCLGDSPDSQHCQRRTENASAAIVTNCDKLKNGKKCIKHEIFKIDESTETLISNMSTHKIKKGVKQRNDSDKITETSTTYLLTNDAMENVDEDYVIDPSVHVDWEGSTFSPSATQVPKAQLV